MAKIIPGDGLNKTRRRGAQSLPCAATNSVPTPAGMTTRSTTKSMLPPWTLNYHYNRHHESLRSPTYYAGPPHPGFYHPYYYHYPTILRLHYYPQWPTASVPNDHISPSKAKIAAPSAATKTDFKSRTLKNDCFKNNMRKENSATNDKNATVASKKNIADETSTKSCGSSDVILSPPSLQNPPSNFNPTLKRQKRPLSPTTSSSSFPLSPAVISSKERVEHRENEADASNNGEEYVSISLPTRIGLQIDLPSDSVNGSSTQNDSCQMVSNEWTKLEIEHLVDALNMDKKTDYSCDHPGGINRESPNLDHVSDPLDLKLMSSAKFVTFKHIGVGLDSCHVPNNNYLRCKAKIMKLSKQVKCPGMMNQPKAGSKTNRNAPFIPIRSNTHKRMKRSDTSDTSKSSLTESSEKSESDSCAKGVLIDPKWSENHHGMTKNLDKLFYVKIKNTSKAMTANEVSLVRDKDDRRLLDAPLFRVDPSKENHNYKTDMKDAIHDTSLPFYVDDIMEIDDMGVGISFHSADYNEKKPAPAFKDNRTVNIEESELDIIFPISSIKCHEEESISTSYKNDVNVNGTDTTAIKEVDTTTDDDFGLDHFIRSLIREDEDYGLVRPSRGFSPTFSLIDSMKPSILL